MNIKYTNHAKEMLVFRRINKRQVDETVKTPQDKSEGKNGKTVLYKNFGKNDLKVVVAKEKGVVVVITEHWIAKKRTKK